MVSSGGELAVKTSTRNELATVAPSAHDAGVEHRTALALGGPSGSKPGPRSGPPSGPEPLPYVVRGHVREKPQLSDRYYFGDACGLPIAGTTVVVTLREGMSASVGYEAFVVPRGHRSLRNPLKVINSGLTDGTLLPPGAYDVTAGQCLRADLAVRIYPTPPI